MRLVFARRAGDLDEALVAVMGDGGAHTDKRFALEAAAYHFHSCGEGGGAKTPDPAAGDLVRLPRGIVIGVMHLMHPGGDHLAHEAREGGGTCGIKCAAYLAATGLVETDPFPSAALLHAGH